MNQINQVLDDLDFYKIQEWIKNNCQSEEAKENAFKYFKLNQQQAEENINLTQEILDSFNRNEKCINLKVSKITNWISILMVDNSTLSINQIKELYNLLIVSNELVSINKNPNFFLWKNFLQQITLLKNGQNKIENIFDEKFQIKDTASSELKIIRKNINRTKTQIKKKIDSILVKSKKNNWLSNDQIVWKDDKSLLAFNVTHKRQINGIVHSYSATKQTAFVEPIAIVEYKNNLDILYQNELKEINKILLKLTNFLSPYKNKLQRNYNLIIKFDLHTSMALFAKKFNCCKPVFNKNQINIIEAKNPNLLVSNKKVVPLNCNLNDNRVLIISGPNAGGKTVAIKTIGLLALMCKQGMHLPAAKVVIPFFKNILTDIGDRQSIENDLSTFSAHITNLKYILELANHDTLIILDELGTGTEPELGTAISQAIIEEFIQKKSFVISTTHMSALKLWAQDKKEITNGGMIFNNEKLKPSYQLQLGLPGNSFALEISKRLGLDKKIILRAKKIVDKNILDFDNIVEKIERKNQQLNNLKIKLEDKEKSINKKEKEILKKEKEINQIFDNANDISADRIENEIISKRREMENLIFNIKSNNASKESIKKAKNIINKNLSKINKQKSKKTKSSENKFIKVGDSVSILNFNTSGTVIKFSDDKQRVYVDVKGKNFKLSINEIKLYKNIKNQSTKKTLSNFRISKPKSFKIDLRGSRTDEALQKTRTFLDQSFISGMSFVHIIHGKGTGALQNAIIEELKNTSFVKNYNFADLESGGTGVTIVEFNI